MHRVGVSQVKFDNTACIRWALTCRAYNCSLNLDGPISWYPELAADELKFELELTKNCAESVAPERDVPNELDDMVFFDAEELVRSVERLRLPVVVHDS